MTVAAAYLFGLVAVAFVVIGTAADQHARSRPPVRRARHGGGAAAPLTDPPGVPPPTTPLALYPDGVERPTITARLWGER